MERRRFAYIRKYVSERVYANVMNLPLIVHIKSFSRLHTVPMGWTVLLVLGSKLAAISLAATVRSCEPPTNSSDISESRLRHKSQRK